MDGLGISQNVNLFLYLKSGAPIFLILEGGVLKLPGTDIT